MSAPQDMYDLAQAAMENAYAPYSKFYVGACIKDENGKLYSGCNVENASYSLVLCAESGAISSLIRQGAKQITEVVIVIAGELICPPCGACRQRLLELAKPDAVVHCVTTTGAYRHYTVAELIPHPFGSNVMEAS